MNIRAEIGREVFVSSLQFGVPFVLAYFVTSRLDPLSEGYQRAGLSLLVALAFKVLFELWAVRIKLAHHIELAAPVSILEDQSEVIKAARDLMADGRQRSTDVRVFQGRPISFEREKAYFRQVEGALRSGRVEKFYRAAYIGSSDDVEQLTRNLNSLSKVVRESGQVVVYPIFEKFNMSFLLFDEEQCQIALPNLAGGLGDNRPDCGLAVKSQRIAQSLLKIFYAMVKETEEIIVPTAGDEAGIKTLEKQVDGLRTRFGGDYG